MKIEKREAVHQLIEKAAKANNSTDAMHFSQAACNAANALACVANTKAAAKASTP